MNDIEGKNILVVGLGRAGRAAADELIRLGGNVYIQDATDAAGFEGALIEKYKTSCAGLFLGREPDADLDIDMVVPSPGVSRELSFIQEYEKRGCDIAGEMELCYRLGNGRLVAITGTNGKTTTTTLTGEIFKLAGRNTHVAGNIGIPVMSELTGLGGNDWIVAEVSSFQLETCSTFRPLVSAILNLTPDHLNRHHTMEAYGACKAKIFENQGADEHLVVNMDDPLVMGLAENAKCDIFPFTLEKKIERGAYLADDMLIIADAGKEYPLLRSDELRIIGRHNIANALAAAAICYMADIEPDLIAQGIRDFAGVEHRIEFCGETDGVRYYNDSKGTNTDAAETAIEAVGENIILIAGGDAKSQDFSGFAKMLPGRVKKLILLGRDGHMIAEAADAIGFREYVYCKDMRECVQKAYGFAEPGDSVLLSPACASWDMYDNYEIRGEDFKSCVKEIAGCS